MIVSMTEKSLDSIGRLTVAHASGAAAVGILSLAIQRRSVRRRDLLQALELLRAAIDGVEELACPA